jgi:acetyl-CoA carboxylase carboxyltransferase component
MADADAGKLSELARRADRIAAMGGPERVARQHAAGKLTARERLALLLDPGTFQELGAHVEARVGDAGPADGVVTGSGRVQDRPIYVYAQDFTVMGGSLGEMHAKKIQAVQDLALRAGHPVVGLNDSGGARIQEGVDALNGYGEIFRRNTHASGVIPQITVIMGPSAGGAVYSPALTDLVIMVRGTAQMFITGPQVIQAVTGEKVSAEDLGGADAQLTRSGVAHFAVDDDAAALALVRELLGRFPANNLEDPPRRPAIPPDPVNLDRLVPDDPNKPYDVRQAIAGILDAGSFLECQAGYADNVVVGWGYLEGQPVAVMANQPRVLAGTLDIDGSDKLARFVRLADAFNFPLITLVDTPGYLPGTAQEYGGIIRHGAKVLYAYAEATVPKITVILRKAYGGAYLAMCSRSLGADLALAWPSAEIAVMGPEPAANIIYRRELEAAENPAAARREKVALYRERFANPYVAASRGYVDAVVAPADTRATLVRMLSALLAKRESRPAKKHGNVPL